MSKDEDSGINLIASSTSVDVLRHLLRVLPFADDMYGPDKIVNGRYEVIFHNSKAERQIIRGWADYEYPQTLHYGIEFEEQDARESNSAE